MPEKDEFDSGLEVATDELIEIPEHDSNNVSQPPIPDDAHDLVSDFLDVKPVRSVAYIETSARYVPFGPVPIDATTDAHGYTGIETKMDATVEGFHADYQKTKKDIERKAEDERMIQEVVNDCYILAAKIDRELGKKKIKPAEFPKHSDEEIAGEGIEEIMSELKEQPGKS